MNYREFAPVPALAPYVKCFWTLEAGDAETPNRERILPDGSIELLFHYGDRYRQYFDESSETLQHRSFIYGQLTNYIEIGATGKTGIVAVRFKPHGLSVFISAPVHELTQHTIEVRDLWSEAAEDLEDKILLATCNDTRVRLLSDFLVSNLRPALHFSDRIETAANMLAADGNIRMSILARHLNMTERTFERAFRTSVGVSPKMFARISRFKKAYNALHKPSLVDLTGVAHRSGYYDQAHFIRDFREFAGLSPSQYLQYDNELAILISGS